MATSSVSFVFRCPCSWRTRPAAGDTATGGGGDGDTTGKCVANCPCVRFCHPTATVTATVTATTTTIPLCTTTTNLAVSFGTNDSESRFVGVRIDRIWQMLRPMREAGSVCSTS